MEENKEIEEIKEPVKEEEKKEEKPKKKKKGIFGVLMSILATLLFLFILFETVIAFLNFNLIRDNKEPKYFVTTTKESKGEYDYTIHDMGLYKIVRKEDSKNYEIKLLPFFLSHE